MAENTKIEWAHHTFNPWIGCTKVSPGCDHCYAEADFDKRRHIVQWGAGQTRKRTAPSTWSMPIKWNAEAERLGIRYRVFCASLADVFDNEVEESWRLDLIWLIHKTPNLDWLLLTKRIGNAKSMLTEAIVQLDPAGEWPVPLPNVWVGATITNQEEANRDIPKLLAVPAAKRFLSMEPLLGPVDLERPRPGPDLDQGGGRMICQPWLIQSGIDWVIVGGESGHQARPMYPDWARSLRDQCQRAGVPFLFKQWGEWTPGENVERERGTVDTAFLFEDGWHIYPLNLATDYGHIDDQPDLYRVGKKAAGRHLDGRTWDEVPA